MTLTSPVNQSVSLGVRVSVLLPTLNERHNIAPLLDALLSAAPSETEIIVIDDDSPDRTWEVVAAVAARDHRVRLLHRQGGRGVVAALKDGFALARGEVIAWMDADFSHPPELLPTLLAQLDAGWDVVVASRYVDGAADRRDEWVRIALSRVFNRLGSLVLGHPFSDYTSGYVVARRTVIDTIQMEGDYGVYFVGFIHHAFTSGFRVTEVPFISVSRLSGASKLAPSMVGLVRAGLPYARTLAMLALRQSRGRFVPSSRN